MLRSPHRFVCPVCLFMTFSFLSRVLMRGILPQPMLADNGERLKVCLIHMNS